MKMIRLVYLYIVVIIIFIFSEVGNVKKLIRIV